MGVYEVELGILNFERACFMSYLSHSVFLYASE